MEIRCTASIMLTDLQIHFASEYGFKPTQRWLPLPGGLAAPRADTRDRGEGGGDFSEIKEQQGLRRAVESAGAGPYNLFSFTPLALYRGRVLATVVEIQCLPS
jgi:hypothetical protein